MTTATQLRSDVAGLVREASSDLDRLWRQIETAAAAEALLRDTLPDLVDAYGSAVATTASNWYDERRDEQGARGRFTAIPAEIGDTGTQALVGWALTEAQDFPAFQTLILGGTQRRIKNFSRFTITGSSSADPASSGWVRTGRGDCEWCAQYLDGVVRTIAYDFPAHDHCNCDADPVWG